jgi:DNA-binding CsgD family transcriptional regulator
VSISSALRQKLARIDRICASPLDARTLRLQLLDVLRSVAPFDAYAWLLTDPKTSVGVAPLADVPCLDELPRLIGLKYRTAINRWTGLSTRPAASLYEATGGELGRSLVWRDLLDAYGIGDVASVVHADRFGCWGFLDLWRSAAADPFSPAEIAFLADTAPQVTSALRRSLAQTFDRSAPGPAAHPGPVVLMLSPQLEVLAQTTETQELLRVLVPPAAERLPIPSSAYNVGAQLIATETGVDSNLPSARAHVAHGRWVTMRAARIGDSAPVTDRNIAVTIEETSPPERVDLFSRALGLTARESELVAHLTTGADTRELAGRMHLSEHTVQDHLKSIFAKTGTNTRRTLLARALGT